MNLNKVISISQPAFVYISMIAFFLWKKVRTSFMLPKTIYLLQIFALSIRHATQLQY